MGCLAVELACAVGMACACSRDSVLVLLCDGHPGSSVGVALGSRYCFDDPRILVGYGDVCLCQGDVYGWVSVPETEDELSSVPSCVLRKPSAIS